MKQILIYNRTDTPDTFMAMCRFLSFKMIKHKYLSSCGGSSAANLLARFAHTDEAIENHIMQITEKESELQRCYYCRDCSPT